MRMELLLAFLCGWPALCQMSSSISGSVTDQSSALISGARVDVKNVDTGAVRSTVTVSSGQYRVTSLPPGQYEIRANKSGFKEAVRQGIHLAVGQDADIKLTLGVGELNQQVTVNADAAPVEVSTRDISGLVADQQVKDLPLNGRSYDQLLTLNPGVV